MIQYVFMPSSAPKNILKVFYDIPKEDAREAVDLAKRVKVVVLKLLEGKM